MTPLTVTELLAAYRNGTRNLRDELARARAAALADHHHAWIRVLDEDQLAAYTRPLEDRDPAELPLYGVPFAIKDNIDLAGVPTTAGCPDYAYTPETSAFVVQRLIDAGAVPVGKTNLDQFATGLVGTRSPYGACPNAFHRDYIAGGSSSGSALATALGQVPFALGTDTAGSGRVPAAFNNLIGLKPTCGRLSTRGVVPACRSLDTVSIFAGTASDAGHILAAAGAYDATDPYARRAQPPALGPGRIPAHGFRFAVPPSEQCAFFGNEATPGLFERAVARLQALGGVAVERDFSPFLEAARLLYEGPWVAERYAAIRDFIDRQPESLLPVTRQIIGAGSQPLAADAFEAAYRLQALRRQAETTWEEVDLAITPTAGTLPSQAAVAAEPVARNSELGYYTNFMNLLDCSAVAVPAGFQDNGLPFGVTLFAPAFYDTDLLSLAGQLQAALVNRLGATGRPLPPTEPPPCAPGHAVELAVCGAHLSGLPLNHQLTERRGRHLATMHTAPRYRLYALPGSEPQRPGLVRDRRDGAAIEVEVWSLPAQEVAGFMAGIAAPLGIGRVELADGRWIPGFLCESAATEGAEEITHLGGWRRYVSG
ncbi:allophanate hydrolase [Halorhodospira halophila]|uniref:Amidase n=1 Tax=Halorhodospira halophila (strain DSM 244 / SL1) TaxID=349124 RepID=A1WZL3_HALHL|nr:allophanate hydrolase [Halorhodospira halophila]ABM63125.1 Amidase [Halorhodospira halophila SL1]MBK1729303.1 allophanate hydrolase [Halorhodospira halophila]